MNYRLRPVPLAISYGRTDSVKNSGGLLINAYAEIAPQDAKTPITLIGVPGLDVMATTGDSLSFIDAVTINGHVYCIDAETLWRFDALNQTLYSLGTIDVGAQAVMATNGYDIMIVDGVKCWTYTVQSTTDERGGTMTPPANVTADSSLFPPVSVCMVDSYLVFNTLAGTWAHTELQSLDVDELSVASAEKYPDKAIRVFENRGILFVFGEESTECYYNAGTLPNAFGRYDGSTMPYGIAGVKAVAKNTEGMAWLAHDGTVQFTNGLAPQRISTGAIHDAIEDLDWSTAHMVAYVHEGHAFFQLSIGTLTLCYDLSTGLWHGLADPTYGRHRAAFAAKLGANTIVMGDIAPTGKLFELDEGTFTFDGENIVFENHTPPYHADQKNIKHAAFEIELDTGEGGEVSTVIADVYLTDANGDYLTESAAEGGDLLEGTGEVSAEPTMTLEYSNDDGRTWSIPNETGIGFDGAFEKRIRWRRLGAARTRRYKVVAGNGLRLALLSRAWIG